MTTRLLGPVSRASKILFDLIMVMTFTASLNAAEVGRDDVRLMMIGALGCSLAWRLIDAAMYLRPTCPGRADILVAALVCAMIFVATLPLVLPFLLVEDAPRALYWSHAIAIAVLFIASCTFGRHWGQV